MSIRPLVRNFLVLTVVSFFTSLDGFTEDLESARRLLSANQAYYNRFVKEKETLLAGRKKEQLSPQEVGKLSALENKLRVLGQDIQRAQARLATGKPAASAKAAQVTASKSGAASDLTVAAWKKMSPGEKERYVYEALGSLERREVFILKPSHFYIQQMDDVAVDPYFAEKFLDDVFIFNIYDQEPHTRDAIDRIRAAAEKVPV